MIKYPPRIPLAHLPTPIEKLERLSAHLGGPEIYVKRDDQTGLATGGNKTRKLEFVLAEALSLGADHLVTLGGPQSNHCRQTAAAAARLGLGCSIVLRGHPKGTRLGNLLLDELLGAEIHWSGERSREAVALEVVNALGISGRRPFFIPVGASTGRGALGYVAAMEEVMAQLRGRQLAIDAMVIASSSAGTQAGLVAGAQLFRYSGHILGISIDSTAEALTNEVTRIALDAGRILNLELDAKDLNVEVNADYLGAGYAVLGDLERDAIRTAARLEGLLLDPVYTGRAMGALIALIRRGAFEKGQRILFWHTGGAAALSAFSDDL